MQLSFLPDMNCPRHRSRGFSLIEILISVGILSVLTALSIPAVNKVLEASRNTKCLSNLRQMSTAISSYAGDNDGYLPSTSNKTWMVNIWSYLYPTVPAPETPSDKIPDEFLNTVFVCPQSAFDKTFNGKRVRDYAFNYRIVDSSEETRDKWSAVIHPSKTSLIADAVTSSGLNISNLRARHGGNFNVLYADGHVSTTAPVEEITKNYNGVFWGRNSVAHLWKL